MTEYITPPVQVNPEDLLAVAVAALQVRVPGFNPSDGGIVMWILEAWSQIAAQVQETASETLTSDFRWSGGNLDNVPAIFATFATGTVTIVGTPGETVPSGTHAYATVGTERIGYTTVDDAELTGGTAAGVTIVADLAGDLASDVTGTLKLQDRLTFVTSITLDAATEGGVDAEDPDVYLDRLSSRKKTSTDTPITLDDWPEIAKQIAGVWRAVAINGYDPLVNPGTYDPDDMGTWETDSVAIACIDVDGAAVVDPVKQNVDDLFNGNGTTIKALREIGFVISVIDPTVTAIGCLFTFTTKPGYDPADVKLAGEDAINGFLSPANAGRTSDERGWAIERIVRQGKAYEVLYGVDGLDAVTVLTLSGGTASGADRLLPGAIPLTSAGTVTGTAA